jgi:hypothetical protein
MQVQKDRNFVPERGQRGKIISGSRASAQRGKAAEPTFKFQSTSTTTPLNHRHRASSNPTPSRTFTLCFPPLPSPLDVDTLSDRPLLRSLLWYQIAILLHHTP